MTTPLTRESEVFIREFTVVDDDGYRAEFSEEFLVANLAAIEAAAAERATAPLVEALRTVGDMDYTLDEELLRRLVGGVSLAARAILARHAAAEGAGDAGTA